MAEDEKKKEEDEKKKKKEDEQKIRAKLEEAQKKEAAIRAGTLEVELKKKLEEEAAKPKYNQVNAISSKLLQRMNSLG